MNKISGYFNQLAIPEAKDELPRVEVFKLIILNKVHLIGVLICVIYGFLFMALDIRLFMLSSFFNAILSFSVYYLGRKSYVTLTKWASLFVAVSQITFYGIILNVNSGIGLMLFYILTLVFYIFEDTRSILISLGILALSCVLFSVSELLGWQYHFLTADTSFKILPLSMITSFLLVSFILAIIKSDKKKADGELIENNNFLQLNNQILIESNTLNKRLLSVISHDLRSPIASLQGFLTLLSQTTISLHEQKELLESLASKTHNINQLIEDILLWTSNQERNLSLRAQKISINKEVDKILSLYAYEIRQKQLQISKNINEQEELISDKNILAFAVRNVLSNAIKYSREGGTIGIDVLVQNNEASIVIENSGKLNDHLMHSLFQQQVESIQGSMNEKGFGLGLYLTGIYLKSIDSSIEVKYNSEGKIGIGITIKNFTLK